MLLARLRFAFSILVFALTASLALASPTITLNPTNQIVTPGATATFTANATVTGGTRSLQWMRSTDGGISWSAVVNDSVFSGATIGTLTVTGVTAAMNLHQFRLTVTQTGGTSPGTTSSSGGQICIPMNLAWDPGATDEGTQVFTAPANSPAGLYYFKLTTQAAATGAWRTALRLTSGTANLYLKQTTPPAFVGDSSYRSDRPGTTGDGFIVPGSAFSAGQTWYLMVNAGAGTQWSLVSGDAYVQNLGTLASDATSSSGNVTIGAEGYRFFKTNTPPSAAAWRVWLNDGAATPATLATTKLAVRRTTVPFIDSAYDHQQPGHMLLVPPYLNTGGDTYFLAVAGTPGTTVNLDSRSAPVTDVAFGASTPFTLPAAGYAVYRVPVPVDQIGWQTELRTLSANVDLAVRRDNAGSEWFNDAFSEITGTVGDSVTLVPPTLTNGTYYITLYNSGAAATGTLVNRVPFSATPDDVSFTGTSLNDETGTSADDANPNKAGWRYFRVGVADAGGIAAQLGKLGWELALAGAPANTEIALRRNFLPGKWLSRNSFSTSFYAGTSSSYYKDFSSATGRLQRPGHQADIWYIGVYAPAAALGNFNLTRTEFVPTDATFASSSTAVTAQAAGTWRYFKFDVPADANLLGWDLRVQGVTGGAVTARVLRDALPGDADASAYDFELASYWTRPSAAGGGQDLNRYLIKAIDGRGPTAAELAFASSYSQRSYRYGFLYAGTYYLGIKVTGATASSYTITSRGIGTETTIYPIKVAGDLALTNGTANIAALAPRELALYRVTVPAGTKTWQLKVAPASTGEVSLKVGSNGRIPSFLSPGPFDPAVWASAGKLGTDFIYATQASPTDTTTLGAGVYYVAVIGEGNSPPNAEWVGTGNVAATLTSVSALPIVDLGAAAANESMQAVSLEAEEVKLYQFTVAPGTLSVEVRLTERTGNPYFSVVQGELPARLRSLGSGGAGAVNDQYYPSYIGGVNDSGEAGSGSFVTLANPTPGTYTVAVRALTNNGVYVPATANLRVAAVVPATPAFANSSTSVTSQTAGAWRYFKFEVPADANLLGWDLRVQGVTGGTVTARVLRDTLPGDADANAYDFELTNYWTRPTAAGGSQDPNRYLIKAIDGRGPTAADLAWASNYNLRSYRYGFLYAGTYYLGVKVSGTTAANYTVTSRGIGTETTIYPIKVAGDLALTNGTAHIAALAPRELALYRVTVPAGTKTWQLKVAPASTGEVSLKVGSNGRIPSFLSPGPFDPAVWASAGKLGTDFIYATQASPTDTTTLGAGVYYVAVIGEGNSPPNAEWVGTGNVAATLTSVSALPIVDLGTAAANETMRAVSLEAEEVKLYQFTVAPGTLSVEVRLTERTGNPYFSVVQGELPARLRSLGSGGAGAVNDQYYPSYIGGVNDSGEAGSGPFVTLANPTPGTYTVAVRALTNNGVYVPATANLRVAAVVPVATDFTNSSTSVTGQTSGTVRYFKFEVPIDANLLGWDLRVQGVTGGTVSAVVLRDTLPRADAFLYSALYGYFDFELTSYWTRPAVGNGTQDPNRYLIKAYDGRGPTAQENANYGPRGWLYGGTYYLGVYVTGTTAASYTVVSRGIGTETTSCPLKVAGDLALTDGTANIAALAPRELALYRLTVPTGTKTLQLKVSSGGTGEASLKIGTNGRMPSFSSTVPQNPAVWAYAEKPGSDFIYATQSNPTDTTTLAAGVYYVAVIGEGNSPAHTQSVGTGNIAATLTSVSAVPVTDLGTATNNQTIQALSLESEEVKLYRFTVAPGTLSVEVRLTERTGNPYFSVVQGELPARLRSLGNGGAGAVNDQYYPSYIGGVSDSGEAGSGSLVTLASPAPGTYTVAVRALTNNGVYAPATANLRVIARPPGGLNFSSSQNVGGGTNTASSGLVADGTRTFYEVTVPATLDGSAPLGWKLSATTTQGTVGLYVYRDVASLATPLAQTTERALILAPPVFGPGSYLVEVRAIGATNFTLTSESVAPRNLATPWTLPTAAAYTTADDIGDSGQIDLANGDYDFYAVTVPAGNAGVLRTVIEAISGNPDLYLRRGSIPSRNHAAPGETETTSNYPYAYSRALTRTTGTEYGNWVPYEQNTETQLKPGIYYLAVHAASNTNVRYRLRVSPGATQTLALNGGSVTNQLLTGGDWRYYKVALPADATMPHAWTLTFAQASGDAVMFIRDSAPPGFRQDSTIDSNGNDSIRDWRRDAKNGDAAQFARYDNPGSYTFTTPPLRPGATYYVGFYAKTDSSFSLSSTATGSVAVPPEIPFYTGSLSNVSIPAGGNVVYRMVAPADAGRLKFALTPSAPIELAIEQGTFPTATGSAHYRNTNWTPTTGTYDQEFYAPWPWVPGAMYYLRLANPSASAVTFSLTSDSGRAAIIEHPLATAVATGGTATFKVVAGGSPAPTYQWKRDGVNLVEGGRFSGTQSATLTITGVLTSDNGSYQVVVANTTATGSFSTSTSATLAVNGAPLIVTQPANADVTVGGAVGFGVSAYSVSPLSYRWQRSLNAGATWADLVDNATVSSSAAANLYLSAIDATRSGEQYRVVITNTVGSVTSSPATLRVLVPVAITTQPVPQTVAVGQSFTFTVVATGVPAPTYQWRKAGSPISGATAASYTKANSQLTDAGDYSVAVTNSSGTVLSSVAALAVTQTAQTIIFIALADVVFSTTPISLEASASSGLAVTFNVVSGPATISGNALTLTAPGAVTVRATQSGNAAFLAAPPVERMFTATAPVTGFAAWRQGAFTSGELANSAVSGPNAIYGVDGLTNLVKYALGLNPKTNITSGLPEVATTATDWTYTYTRPAARSDVTYAVEVSTNLTSWTTVGVSHDLVSADAVAGTQTWRARYPLASAANAFFRLRVTR